METTSRPVNVIMRNSITTVETEVKIKAVLQPTVSRPGSVSSTHLGSMTRVLLLLVADLLMSGTLSDERTGL
jgi:hypothetical protein